MFTCAPWASAGSAGAASAPADPSSLPRLAPQAPPALRVLYSVPYVQEHQRSHGVDALTLYNLTAALDAALEVAHALY